MSRRIEIELTSARPDGTWTWRAAGAREPKGVLHSALIPGDSKVGDLLRADVETELDGTTVLSTSPLKAKAEKSGLLEILPTGRPFEAVTQQLARRERGDRSDRGDRPDRGDRRDRPARRPGSDRPGSDRPGRADGDRPRTGDDRRPPRRDSDRAGSARPSGDPSGDRRPPRRDSGHGGAESAGADRRDRRPRPNFTPPPDLPQRPKPKRLKPGRAHRAAVLAGLPEEQRAVAERALQGGIPAVRQAV
ncbi:MAG TPA: hypothetical protein VGM78_15250, partial [Ilumatobacteraceae bacterium]